MATPISKALMRVRNNKKPKAQKHTSEGIFLSIDQLKELSDALKDIKAGGAFFMIGKVAGKAMQTVEILPYDDSIDKKVLNGGHLKINIGHNNSSGNDIFINNDLEPNLTFSIFGDDYAALSSDLPTPVSGVSTMSITTGSQRTPPPVA